MKRWGWVRTSLIVTLITLGLITLGLAGGATAVWQAAQESTRPAEQAPTVVQVRVFRVAPVGQSPGLQLTGSVRPRFETDMAFRVSGKLAKRLVEVGHSVQPGQPLFELDAEDYRLQQQSAEANLQVAKAALVQAQAEERRLAELRRSNAVSQSEYDRGLSDRDIAQGRLESAQRQLELANNQLAYCQLQADTAGVVTAISAEAGQVVTVGTPVCTVAQLDQLEAVIDIPENRWPRTHDLETEATFWSLPEVRCRVRLREISPTADPITRTYRARFTLLSPSEQIKLGMTTSVVLTNGDAPAGFELPLGCIARQQGRPMVWRVAEGRNLEAVPIQIEHYTQQAAIVSGSLVAGDLIVSAGTHLLDSSMQVRVWEIQK